jgi:hypothetical protein
MICFRHIARLSVLLPVLVTAYGQQVSKSEENWKAFREAYPYHIQAIAISNPNPDGTRTLIVAEPPPHVTLQSLVAMAPQVGKPVVKTQKIGPDGWVRDVLIELPPIGDNDLRTLLDRIHQHLFGTTYKAYVLPITNGARAPTTAVLDLQVSAGDLSNWLIRNQERFSPLYGGDAVPIGRILSQGPSGVHFSAEAGLVTWVVPRHANLAQFRREARQFAVDSDLIVGALAGPARVAIIGRERIVPVSVLPPLRAETIFLLACVDTDELAQSYERMNFFAGEIGYQNFDWAPAYLSDALIDTELWQPPEHHRPVAEIMVGGWKGRVFPVSVSPSGALPVRAAAGHGIASRCRDIQLEYRRRWIRC